LVTEEIINENNPGHALLSLNRGEDLCRVLKGYRTFSERITDCKKVDEAEIMRSAYERWKACNDDLQHDRPNLSSTASLMIQ